MEEQNGRTRKPQWFNYHSQTAKKNCTILRKQLTVTAIFFFCIVSLSYSQLRWQQVSNNEFGTLPKGVKVFKTTDSLNGRPFIGYYIEARLKDKKLQFTTQVGNGSRFTPTQYYEREDSPVVVVNGTFFSFETNQNLNVVMKDGYLRGYNVPALKSRNSDSFYYPTRAAIGINKKRKADAAWIFTDTAQLWPYAFEKQPIVARGKSGDPDIRDLHTIDLWKWWRMETAIGGGPMLVQDGVVYITYKEEQMFLNGEYDKHPRTAMGYTYDNKLIILCIQGRFPGTAEGATLQEEAKILVDLGCEEALNLDGGGSSCMLVNGKETIKPSDKEGQRAVPAVFIIKAKTKR